MSTPYYYKSSKTLTNQGTHNSSQFWHSRVVRSSNLTFKGYLAGTTPMLFDRSTVDFLASSVGAVYGNDSHLATCKPYERFLDKELHGTYLLDGDHQQRSGR